MIMTSATLSPSATGTASYTSGFPVYLKGGAMAGVLAALVNNAWNLIAPSLGAARLPQVVNVVSVSMASILGALIASVGLWIGVKLFKQNGPLIFVIGAAILGVLSCIGNFKDTLPNGMPTPEGFALLTVPMHLAATAFIVTILPRIVRKAA
jgi:hypothetical protein